MQVEYSTKLVTGQTLFGSNGQTVDHYEDFCDQIDNMIADFSVSQSFLSA